MKVVITGASGFLGRSVIRRFSGTAHTVVPVSRRMLPGLFHAARYADAPGGDVLMHLAESADRAAAGQNGAAYEHETSTNLNALLKKRYQRVIYASSAVLYGDRAQTSRQPADEIFVSDTYTRVKRHSEIAVLDSPGGVVARLGNLFGPGMSNDNVMSTILRQIPGDGPVRVRDTRPIRDFLWVDDGADVLVRMAVGTGAGIFNVGSGVGHSVGDLVSVALGVGGQPDRPVVAMHPGARASHLVLDISDTVSAWQWSPETTLVEGIRRLLSATAHP
ncbi:MAG TPA: NAD(P)-dependent oxidoreductase [Vicinamibacterales bacterium]|nr:NAD(P)-dependent oxidoreductase [Vicinamibacterales bacterium]